MNNKLLDTLMMSPYTYIYVVSQFSDPVASMVFIAALNFYLEHLPLSCFVRKTRCELHIEREKAHKKATGSFWHDYPLILGCPSNKLVAHFSILCLYADSRLWTGVPR